MDIITLTLRIRYLCGWCVDNPTFCNDKLIGAHNLFTPGTSPEDLDGHGSHTASTAGGNFTELDLDIVGGTTTLTISGVAPHANLIAYKSVIQVVLARPV